MTKWSLYALLCLVSMSGSSWSQDTEKWADIDCAKSRFVNTQGLKCRATQEFAGASGPVSGAGAGGQFQRSSAFGTSDGAKVFYMVTETISTQSSVRTTRSLEEALRTTAAGKDGRAFSAMTSRRGVDYMTFSSAASESCIGLRRYGPSRGDGFKWILYGTRCAPKGKPTSSEDIDAFISTADYRV